MSVSNELILESQDTYQMFQRAMGERFAPYCTPSTEDANLRAMCEWAKANLPGGFESLKDNIGAFELSFRACAQNGTLQRDPAWLSRAERKTLFGKFNNVLPAAVSKAIYFGDTYLLSEEQSATLKKIGGEVAFKQFMEEA